MEVLWIEIRVDKASPKAITAACKMLQALHLSDPHAYGNLLSLSNSLESPRDFIHVCTHGPWHGPAADYLLPKIYSYLDNPQEFIPCLYLVA